MLPQGPFSALAANVPVKAKYSLCGQKLVMPAVFLAQNGAELHESSPIGITGCAKTRQLTTAQKLLAALKACREHHRHSKRERQSCERKAHKKYGEAHGQKTSKKKKS